MFPQDESFDDNAINWNDGRRLKLQSGQTAICTALAPGQLYALFFYNSSASDQNVHVNVVWSNSNPPHSVTVPGTFAATGSASLCFVHGDDTRTASISIPGGEVASGAEIECWIGSLRMPTNTEGIENRTLTFDGQPRAFGRAHRCHSVPRSKWYSVEVSSGLAQFMYVEYYSEFASVYVLNKTHDSLLPGQVTAVGRAASDKLYYVKLIAQQKATTTFQGDGRQWVWMNASSSEDSRDATITAQSL